MLDLAVDYIKDLQRLVKVFKQNPKYLSASHNQSPFFFLVIGTLFFLADPHGWSGKLYLFKQAEAKPKSCSVTLLCDKENIITKKRREDKLFLFQKLNVMSILTEVTEKVPVDRRQRESLPLDPNVQHMLNTKQNTVQCMFKSYTSFVCNLCSSSSSS